VPATYVDSDGTTNEDELIILWVYQAVIDNLELYNNFGSLLSINLPSSQSYKELLKNIINISVEGPTIKTLNTAVAALLDLPVIIESSEVVEELYGDSNYQYVITDKNVYRVQPQQELNRAVVVGGALVAGTQLTSGISIIDTVIDPRWWLNEIPTNKLALAGHVFAANTKNQLIFENKPTQITYVDGVLNFPVIGRAADVASFREYLNRPEHLPDLLKKLTFTSGKDGAISVSPVDFLFANVFRNNVLLVKLEFYSSAQMGKFFELFPVLQPYLPPHVYILLYLTLQQPVEQLGELNFMQMLDSYPGDTFSCDGSDPSTGARPGTVSPITDLPTDPDYYKDLNNRLFCISAGPYRNGNPLHVPGNLDYLSINNAVHSGGVQAGKLRTYIPENATTKEVPTILLIDF